MTVYVEYVLLDNFVLDALLLWAAARTMRLPVSKLRLFLGGATGAACAAVSVYLDGVWLYLLKAVCLAAMCAVTVGFGKKLFWYILLTLAYTFVAGGAIVGLFELLKVDVFDNGFYEMRVPLFVYLLAAVLVAFLSWSVVIYIKNVKKIAPHIVKIAVKLDKTYNLTGFCDSGNTLCFEGVPVCFVTKKFGGFSDYFAKQTIAHKTVSIPVATVAGSVTVKATIATVAACGKECKVYLALPAQKCQTVYNVLLSNEFCGG